MADRFVPGEGGDKAPDAPLGFELDTPLLCVDVADDGFEECSPFIVVEGIGELTPKPRLGHIVLAERHGLEVVRIVGKVDGVAASAVATTGREEHAHQDPCEEENAAMHGDIVLQRGTRGAGDFATVRRNVHKEGQYDMTLSADDLLAIQQLYARYNHAIDFGDAEAWAECFTPDGVFASSARRETVGREALRAFAEAFSRQMKGRHWTNNLVVEGDGDEASGRCYLALYVLGEGGARLMTTGVYHDELVRTAQGWRFRRRDVTLDQ